jgi:hypothetical protein
MGKLFGVLAGVVLGVGLFVSAATVIAASPPDCGHRNCSDEVAASGLTGKARSACFKSVIADCKANACSCTGGTPACACPASPSGAFLDGAD